MCARSCSPPVVSLFLADLLTWRCAWQCIAAGWVPGNGRDPPPGARGARNLSAGGAHHRVHCQRAAGAATGGAGRGHVGCPDQALQEPGLGGGDQAAHAAAGWWVMSGRCEKAESSSSLLEHVARAIWYRPVKRQLLQACKRAGNVCFTPAPGLPKKFHKRGTAA